MSSITDSLRKSMSRISSPIISPDSTFESTTATATASSSTSNSWTDISAFTWKGWLLLIFVLALLGINIFAILGRGADEANSIFGPAIKKIIALFVGTTGQIVGTTAIGAKTVIDTTTNVADNTLTKIADATTVAPLPPNPARKGPVAPPPEPQNESSMPPDHGPVHGPGFCYLGSGEPFRSCAQVGYDDLCMSGEVFPTHDQCVNPAMR